MTDPEDRAERALRDALSGRADAFEPQELTVPRRVRRSWGWVPAAAAVVVLVGGVTAIGVTAGGGGSSSSDSAGSADSASIAGDQAAPGARPTSKGRAVVPKDGTGRGGLAMRWVSRYDVELLVPSGWGYAAPPARPDCIQKPGDTWDDAPRAPYVATDVTGRAVPDLGCEPHRTAPAVFGDLPFELWQPTLSFSQDGASSDRPADGTWHYRGWTLTRWTMPTSSAGEAPVQLTLLTSPGQDALAARIKASAQRFTTDANGCAASSPLQSDHRVTPPAVTSASRLTPSSVSVCQYRVGARGAGLIGSRRLTGSQMGKLLQGIAQAPSGSGPNSPSGCADGPPPDTAIELRYNRGGEQPASAYVYYDVCAGHGIYDADSVKQLTAADCLPLFAEPPITAWGVPSTLDGVCRR